MTQFTPAPFPQLESGVPDPDHFARRNGGSGGASNERPHGIGDEGNNVIEDADYWYTQYKDNGGFGASAGVTPVSKFHSRDAGSALFGHGGDDFMRGYGGNDTLDGGTGKDTLFGDNGNDLIYGGDNNDLIDGGADNDTLWGGDGNDTLHGGTGNDALHGGADNDVMFGDAGDDTLVGGEGADIMRGGTGNDVYVVDNRGDQVFEDFSTLGGNADKIYTTLSSYDLSQDGKGASVEILQYTGPGNFVGRGNALDNILVGAGGADRLYGGEGRDLLNGGDGNDTLDGGNGNDTLNGEGGADVMYGGRGNDVYIVDNPGDKVIDIAPGLGSIGVGRIGGAHGMFGVIQGGGHDTVQTTLNTYDLGGVAKGVGVEDLQFKGVGNFKGTGNNLDNAITGGAGSDLLDGSAGNDTLTGGAGKDVFQFGDHGGHDTITDFTHGQDTINLAHVSGMHSFDQLKLTDVDGGVRVDFGDSSVLVSGQKAASMSAADFSFTQAVFFDSIRLPELHVPWKLDPIGPIGHPDPIGPLVIQPSPLLTHGLSPLDSYVLTAPAASLSVLAHSTPLDHPLATSLSDNAVLRHTPIGVDHATMIPHDTVALASAVDYISMPHLTHF